MSAKRLVLTQQVGINDPLEETMSPLQYRAYAMCRLIFVSSMYFRLLNIQNPTPQELDRVNIRFNIAANESALRLPALISNWIWKKIDLNTIFQKYLKNTDSFNELADEILRNTPWGARYGDGKRMKQDILSIFESVSVA